MCVLPGSTFSINVLTVLHTYAEVDYGSQGLLAYAVHPGVPTEMGLRMPSESHFVLTDTPELSGDAIAFLTRERREWLAGRYIGCECSIVNAFLDFKFWSELISCNTAQVLGTWKSCFQRRTRLLVGIS